MGNQRDDLVFLFIAILKHLIDLRKLHAFGLIFLLFLAVIFLYGRNDGENTNDGNQVGNQMIPKLMPYIEINRRDELRVKNIRIKQYREYQSVVCKPEQVMLLR